MATGKRTCSNCRSEVVPDDNFCQECGLLLQTVPETAVQAILTCLNCGCQHEEDSKICTSCGSLMSDVGVYTTAVRAAPQAELSHAQHCESFSEHKVAKQITLSSPFLEGRALDEVVPNLWWRKLLAFSHSFVDLSESIALLAFFAIVVFWVIDCDKTRAVAATQAQVEQARLALAGQQIDQAVPIMERISLAKSGCLNSDERALFNSALLARAKYSYCKNDNKVALFDLLRITPDCKQFDSVRAQISQCLRLADDRQVVTATQIAMSSPTAVRASRTRKTGGLELAAGNLNGAVLPKGADSVADDETAQSRQRYVNAGTDAPRQYSDSDVARYNKLLADYFGSPARVGQESGHLSDGHPGDASDPPTLKEWLDLGKPDF